MWLGAPRRAHGENNIKDTAVIHRRRLQRVSPAKRDRIGAPRIRDGATSTSDVVDFDVALEGPYKFIQY